MMKRGGRQIQAGFTIVELLIVIVVIAILAAATTIAYNGVQVRAENSKTIQAVRAYEKALRQYAIEKGEYPSTGVFCLGNEYSVLDGTTAGCQSETVMLSNSSSTAPLELLKPYLGNTIVMPSTKILKDSDGVGYVGAFFYGTSFNFTLNGKPIVLIGYTIEDDTCPVGPVFDASGAGAFTGAAVERSVTVNDNASQCMLVLPVPSDL